MYKNNIGSEFLEELNIKLREDGVQKVVAGAVVYFHDGSILLLERAPKEFKGGLVELPSGVVELGESIIDGLAREIKEETGLEISEIKRYIGSFDYQSSSGRKTRQFNFIVSVDSNDVRINPLEHSKFYIVSPVSDKIQKLKISEKTRGIIQKSFES
ncbi:MAG: NUDIX hydrolase [bacterium]